MTTFTIHTPDSAPAESKQQLETTQQRKGLIPNLYGVLAEAPIALEAYETLASLLMRSSFTPTERHVVWFREYRELADRFRKFVSDRDKDDHAKAAASS